VLKEIRAAEGKTVQVNTVVAVIDESGAAAAPNGAAKAVSAPVAAPAAAQAAAVAEGPATDVVMPQMGESIFEGTITKWLKQVGDQVTRDEPLFEISTDKVDAEIPAPVSGVLTEIKAETGKTVQVNSVVAVIGGAAAGTATPAVAAVAVTAEKPAVQARLPAQRRAQHRAQPKYLRARRKRQAKRFAPLRWCASWPLNTMWICGRWRAVEPVDA